MKHKIFGKYVEVYEYDNGDVGINWASIGTVSPDEASKFLKDLKEAINYADEMEQPSK